MLPLYAACVLIGAVVILWYSIRRQLYYYKLIPGMKHRFYNILGDLIFVDLSKDLGVQALDKFGQKLRLFPKEPLGVMWFSYFPIVMAVKSDAVMEILKGNKMVDRTYHYEWLKPMFGTGLVTSNVKWKSRRRMFNPCFHADVLRNYLETFNKMSQKLVKVLQKEAQKDFSYISDPLTLCALDTVCETIFGTTVKVLENDKIKASNAFKRFGRGFMTRGYSFWLWPDFIFWNTKIGKDLKKDVNIVQGFVKNIIEEKKKRYLSGDRTIYNGKHKALIDVLLEKHMDTHEFSEEDVRAEAITFMSAGHDTVGLAATWALYLIGQHPAVQAKLHEEVDHVFGEDRERPVTEEDLKDLRYMDCVLKECSRLYPTVPLVTRKVTEETNICGFTLPRGTTCVIFTYFLHRDKEVFSDPEKFDPDRFSAENRVNIPEFAYIPFSSGIRNCIGFKFAEMELGTIMSSIFRNFTVESLNKVVPVLAVSLHPSEPVRIKIRSRAIKKT